MKKCICILLIASLSFFATACDNKTKTEDKQNAVDKQNHPEMTGDYIDYDLTELNKTMLYPQVFGMLTEPAEYIGKRVKIKGQFVIYENPKTGEQYPACMVTDETECCSQGLEFLLAEDKGYPEIGTEIVLIGEFRTYEEGGYEHCHLVNAEIEG